VGNWCEFLLNIYTHVCAIYDFIDPPYIAICNVQILQENWKKNHALLIEEFVKIFSENDEEKKKKITARHTSPAIVTPCFFNTFRTFLSHCTATFEVSDLVEKTKDEFLSTSRIKNF
jgi:hypothetical protein